MHALRTLACFAVVTASAPVALAQTQGGEPAPGTPPPVAATPPPPTMPGAAGEERDEATRFRWGISGFGGRYFVNGTGGGIGGIDARFGAQINRMLGFYAQPILMIGGGAAVTTGQNSASTSVSLVALYGVAALADFTFGDMFYLAVGPELLRGAAAQAATQASENGAGASASAEAGTFFAVEARAGLALGSTKGVKRKAFTIGIDLHTIFTSKPMIVPVLALGYDAF